MAAKGREKSSTSRSPSPSAEQKGDWRELEKLFGRIQKLLQPEGTKVEWNASIVDPDDPAEKRQIDVLVTTPEGLRISVECRDRTAAQSVMWIEELAGRKASLGLDGMIAVSARGFSALAIKKARHFGILLYDLKRLTDEEIATWGRPAAVEACFVRFSRLTISVALNRNAASRVPAVGDVPFMFRNDVDGFTAVMQTLGDKIAAGNLSGQVYFNPSEYSVIGEPTLLVHCDYAGELVNIAATCLGVSKIGDPQIPGQLRDIGVDRFDHSVTELGYANNKLYVVLDFERIVSPANSILRHVAVKLPREGLTLSSCDFVGSRRMITRSTAIQLQIGTLPIVSRDSS